MPLVRFRPYGGFSLFLDLVFNIANKSSIWPEIFLLE